MWLFLNEKCGMIILVVFMKAVGIICEYNPFHNGHLYHIEQIKKRFPKHIIVLVVNGPFTQRGEASILTKWEKTEIALSNNIDLVVELPFIFASGSADLFACGAVTILNELQVEYLVFGSEENKIKKLTMLASIQFQDKFKEKVKRLISSGINYPKSLSIILKEMTGFTLSSPNDLLGVSYIKEIIRQNSSIIPVTIKRTNCYHEKKMSDHIASATSIRNAIKSNKNIKSVVPKISYSFIHTEMDIENFYPFLKYKIISEKEQLLHYHEVSSGIISRLQKYVIECNSLDELIHMVKSKNETYNKLKRMFLYILCGLTTSEADFYKEHPYIRILGFNDYGKKYLKQIKNDVSIPIITNYSNDSQKLLSLDFRIHQIYIMGFKKVFQKRYFDEEIKRIPIYQKKNMK